MISGNHQLWGSSFVSKCRKFYTGFRNAKKKIEKIFSILEISAFELVAWKTYFYRERIVVIGSQYVNKQSQDFRYYWNLVFQTEVLSEWSKNMTKLLPCRFKQFFGPFNMLAVHKCSDTGLLMHLSNHAFLVYNFVNASLMRLTFYVKMLKIWCRFRTIRKNFRKHFQF